MEINMEKTKICSVVGFPLGAMSTKAKAFEAKQATKDGADEIDMVINIGALKENKRDFVKKDIKAVVNAANGKTVKVIIECCYLTNKEKRTACQLAKEAGAAFVKTSTGFGSPPEGIAKGATVKDVKLMKEVFGGDVKAAGEIRTAKDAQAMIDAGATRIGASSGVKLTEENPDLAKYIDHTNLKPTADSTDIKKLCDQAKLYKFASVCVNSCWVKFAKKIIKA